MFKAHIYLSYNLHCCHVTAARTEHHNDHTACDDFHLERKFLVKQLMC